MEHQVAGLPANTSYFKIIYVSQMQTYSKLPIIFSLGPLGALSQH